jgi:hypothetical protein
MSVRCAHNLPGKCEGGLTRVRDWLVGLAALRCQLSTTMPSGRQEGRRGLERMKDLLVGLQDLSAGVCEEGWREG